MKIGTAIMMVALTAGTARAADIRVMSGGAPKEALAVLTPQFEKQTGHKVVFIHAVIGVLRQKLEAGEQADAALMPIDAIDAMVKASRLRAEGRVMLGRLGVSLVVREGAAKPDISTTENFRKVLLAARSIAHPVGTPSAANFIKVIEQLGIAEAVQKKAIHRTALDGGVELVATGEAEIGVYPTSEVVHVKGVSVVGALPAAAQPDIVYGGAVSSSAAAPDAAAAFVKFLGAAENRKVWKDAGFDPSAG